MALDINADELKKEIVETLSEIRSFVQTDRFQSLLNELRSIHRQSLRREFVRDVVIDEEELANRGILVPEGLIIQRSAFRDGRPTLFCVTKLLKNEKWKVTITYDDDVNERPLT
jgi:hypothetical protein